jgi:hypothetical protein
LWPTPDQFLLNARDTFKVRTGGDNLLTSTLLIAEQPGFTETKIRIEFDYERDERLV